MILSSLCSSVHTVKLPEDFFSYWVALLSALESMSA